MINYIFKIFSKNIIQGSIYFVFSFIILLIPLNIGKKKVIFTGKQNNVRMFLDIAEIYVQPTLNQGRMEGAPISIQEAMANEKVIIGSNIPGIKDQLYLFPNHLFNAGDISDLKNKLKEFMSNSIQENKYLGFEFSKFVGKHYNLNNEQGRLQSF